MSVFIVINLFMGSVICEVVRVGVVEIDVVIVCVVVV